MILHLKLFGLSNSVLHQAFFLTLQSASESVDRQRTHRDSTASTSSLNEQTQLFLEKMILLEKKLQSMESQLKNVSST
jgi:predicted phage-related endonuclease